MFPGGLSSNYIPDPALLNFSDRVDTDELPPYSVLLYCWYLSNISSSANLLIHVHDRKRTVSCLMLQRPKSILISYFNPLTHKALKYFIKTSEAKVFFSIWNHHKCLRELVLIHLNTYVMGLRPLEIFVFLRCGKLENPPTGDRLSSSFWQIWIVFIHWMCGSHQRNNFKCVQIPIIWLGTSRNNETQLKCTFNW